MKSSSRWWVIAVFAALLVVVANLPGSRYSTTVPTSLVQSLEATRIASRLSIRLFPKVD